MTTAALATPFDDAAPVATYEGVTRAVFEAEIVPRGVPAVLRGVAADWPATAAARRSPRALIDYLAGHDTGAALATMIGPPVIDGRFFYRDDFTGFNFDRAAVPFRAVAERLLAALDGAPGPAIYSGAAAAGDHFPGFAADNPMPLLDAAVMPRLWIGNAVTVSTHHDGSSNLACVVAGQREFILFPPDQVANLYVGPLENTISGQPVSMVDPLAPDLARYPHFAAAAAVAQRAVLEPGDAIYLPALWWHHVRSTARLNLLVNYWWSVANDGSAFDALIHALLAIRNRPANERAAWRSFFDHYVFADQPEDGAHLPPHARGVLGPPSPARAAAIRAFLLRGLAPRG